MNSPSKLYLNAAKKALRYIRGIINISIFYERGKELRFEGHIDSNWADNFDDGKRTSGYLFPFDLRSFFWNLKKQEVVAR